MRARFSTLLQSQGAESSACRALVKQLRLWTEKREATFIKKSLIIMAKWVAFPIL